MAAIRRRRAEFPHAKLERAGGVCVRTVGAKLETNFIVLTYYSNYKERRLGSQRDRGAKRNEILPGFLHLAGN